MVYYLKSKETLSLGLIHTYIIIIVRSYDLNGVRYGILYLPVAFIKKASSPGLS